LAKRAFDAIVSVLGLLFLLPLIAVLSVAIVLESRGGVFYRARRVGLDGREFSMLKFRKMRPGAVGPALTVLEDPRFTRVGRFIARTKLDELPQLWNVVRGEMSLVGPRPEDPAFVALRADEYARILRIRPGITGLSQLAFRLEGEILDPRDRVNDYVVRFLPQKIAIDLLYLERRTFSTDLRILGWTAVAVLLGLDVAIDRRTGCLGPRRRPRPALATTKAQS
jgi:lipopolysaccharide/colanic/teichoic acid biosynthesis glycosyltransferase